MKSKSVLSPAYEVQFNIWDLCVLPLPLSPQQLFQTQVKIRKALMHHFGVRTRSDREIELGESLEVEFHKIISYPEDCSLS